MQFLRLNFRKTTCCISFPRQVSRVCITSDSTNSQMKSLDAPLLLQTWFADEEGNHASEETDNSYNADEAISYVPDESVELQRHTNDTAREDREAEQIKDKKADITGNQIKQMKDKVKENAYDMEKTTEDTREVLEAAAKKTKDTAKDAWEATKDTTRKIKENVVGNSSFNIDDVWEDHTGKRKIKGNDFDHEKKDY